MKRADILAQSDFRRAEKLAYVAEYEQLYGQIEKEQQCLSIQELAVDGNDLIALGMKPGKKLGEVLKSLLELVLDEPECNTKERLLAEARKMIQ